MWYVSWSDAKGRRTVLCQDNIEEGMAWLKAKEGRNPSRSLMRPKGVLVRDVMMAEDDGFHLKWNPCTGMVIEVLTFDEFMRRERIGEWES